MITPVTHMPTGTTGFRASGTVTSEDYEKVLEPALAAAAEDGPLRLLYILDEDLDSYTAGAMWSDTRLWSVHRRQWERIAIATDVDWVENAVKAFGWLMPGRIQLFDDDEIDRAKLWLVSPDEG
jgi:SpoIIAA-like